MRQRVMRGVLLRPPPLEAGLTIPRESSFQPEILPLRLDQIPGEWSVRFTGRLLTGAAALGIATRRTAATTGTTLRSLTPVS